MSTSNGWAKPTRNPRASGCYYLDHLTHNVVRGRLTEWAGFYERLFNFRQIRYFDIAGKMSGLHSRAMTSPDGKIRIPINEDAGESGQIEEYLQEYHGEGIQHVALGSTDLYESIESLIARGVDFMPAPNEIYYSRIDKRLPSHAEPLDRLQGERHPDRRRGRRGRRLHEGAAAALRQNRHRADLLRIHPAQGR